jgi:hypothetical protein
MVGFVDRYNEEFPAKWAVASRRCYTFGSLHRLLRRPRHVDMGLTMRKGVRAHEQWDRENGQTPRGRGSDPTFWKRSCQRRRRRRCSELTTVGERGADLGHVDWGDSERLDVQNGKPVPGTRGLRQQNIP